MKIINLLRRLLSKRNTLKGLRIWVGGAVPERQYWSHPLVDRDILEFTSVFSALVFENEGLIIHGCQPSLTPILKRQAKRFSFRTKQLKLFVSSYWHKEEIKASEDFELTVVQANYNGKEFDRNASLKNLRYQMARQADVAIFIGGKLHKGRHEKPGVPEEIEIAQELKIPTFILGGVDGAAQEFAESNYIREMNKIALVKVIEDISREKNLCTLPSYIVGELLNNIEAYSQHRH